MDLAYIIDRASKWFPENIAVVDDRGKYLFKEVFARANQFANALTKMGHRKGDRVAIVSRNCVEYVEADLALYKSGLVRVALNPRISPKEISYIINDAEASCLLVSPDLADLVDQIRQELKTVQHFIITEGPRQGMTSYQELIKRESTHSAKVELKDEDLCQLFYTGGTTGVPKGVELTHKAVIFVSLNLQADAFHLTSRDAILSAATLAHGNGFRTVVAWMKGARHVLLNGFDPKQVLETIEKEGVTILTTVPVTLNRLCEYPNLSQYDLSSLRMITYGAAPMPVEKLKNALRIFGQRLVQLYGQAEAPITITVFPAEDHILEGSESETKRLASAGRAYSTVEVKVVNKEGEVVKPGEIGVIIVRSPHMMSRYWKNLEATKEALKDGWLYTGDMATVDERDYVYIVDRAKDMIISGGYNIYAREVEEVLYSHPAVQEAAVIGVPDDNWGEAVKAIVVLKTGNQATEDQLIDHCRKHLASYKKPKSIEFMSELPKSGIGKILKQSLKEKYWQGYDRRVH